jgi:hypothetical protein
MYYVTFVDDYSRTTWLYLLKFKSEVFDAFKDFHNLVKTHFNLRVDRFSQVLKDLYSLMNRVLPVLASAKDRRDILFQIKNAMKRS